MTSKKTILSLLMLMFFTLPIKSYSQGFDVNWAVGLGGSGVSPYSTVIDDSNNVYTVGSFGATYTCIINGSPFTVTSSGNGGMFIHKMDSSGNVIWVKGVSGNGTVSGYSITDDDFGNLYITGTFNDTIDFDPGVGVSQLISTGNNSAYVLNLSTNGDFKWRQFGAISGSSGLAITTDKLGNIFLTGFFPSNTGGGSGVDGFITKFDSIGSFEWSKTFGGYFNDHGYAVVTDDSGNVYVGGDEVGYGILRKYDGLGNVLWTYTIYGSSNYAYVFDICLNPNGESYINAKIGSDNYIRKIGSSGNLIWSRTMPGGINISPLSLDLLENVYIPGSFSGNKQFNYPSPVSNLSSFGGYDIYIVKLDSANNFQWVKQIGGAGDEFRGLSVLDLNGNIYLTGKYGSTVDLDPGTNSYILSGGPQIFASKYTQCQDIGIDYQVACDSFMWTDSVVYYASTQSPFQMDTNVFGCDSATFLFLTIHNSQNVVDTIIACDSLTWIDGNTYYSSNNTAVDTLITNDGCDSVVTLDLTILNSTAFTDTLVICDSLTWIDGIIYTSSNNTAKDTLVNVAGCDSIVTLNLTINNTTFAIDTLIACDTLTWIDGVTYTTSNNTAVHTLVNTAGCDSVVTLNLTINYSSHPIDTVFTCESYTWINGVTYTASNNSATVNLSNVNGCDSIITLNLTISSLSSSYSWVDNGSANYYFTNTSTGNHTNSHWAFGDGSSTSANSTSHHYSANGLYVVVLAIYDSTVVGDSCISYFTDTIVVTGAPNSTSCNAGWVVFTDSTTGGVTIVNSSTGANLTYHWEFGDGDTSNLQFPSHTYTSNGPFNLCLTVDDGNGCSDTYCDSISSNGVLFKNGFDLNVVANYPLGVQNIESKNEVKIYPNPTSSTLNIETQNFKINKILIRDNSGKVVKTITSNFNVVNVEDLASGVYHIELFEDEETVNKKFIKQ